MVGTCVWRCRGGAAGGAWFQHCKKGNGNVMEKYGHERGFWLVTVPFSSSFVDKALMIAKKSCKVLPVFLHSFHCHDHAKLRLLQASKGQEVKAG